MNFYLILLYLNIQSVQYISLSSKVFHKQMQQLGFRLHYIYWPSFWLAMCSLLPFLFSFSLWFSLAPANPTATYFYVFKTQLRGSQWLYCQCIFGSSVCCPEQRDTFIFFRPTDPLLLDLESTPRPATFSKMKGLQQEGTVIASITKYTKTKCFLLPFMPMCRITIFDKSLVYCVLGSV